MRRRQFLAAAGGAAVWPVAGRTQSHRMRRIGVLIGISAGDAELQRRIARLRQRLRDLGWTDADVALEVWSAEGKLDRLPTLAAELVQAKVDAIVTGGTEPVQAARRATGTIPIVMASIGDAVGAGIVPSLARPGGNVTGLTLVSTEQGTKRLELMKEILPGLCPCRRALERQQCQPTLGVGGNESRFCVAGPPAPIYPFAECRRSRPGFSGRNTRGREGAGYDGGRARRFPSSTDRGFGNARKTSSGRRVQGNVCRWWAYELRPKPNRDVGTNGWLYRQDIQGRETWRPSDSSSNQIRACHQSENGQGTRPHDPRGVAPARRRGDRMRRREFIALVGAALACSTGAAARARAPAQLAPQNGSAPAQRAAQVVPQPVPQVTPQLNVPGPQTAPSRPGNPVQQLAPLGGANPVVSTGRVPRRGAPRGRRVHRRHSG